MNLFIFALNNKISLSLEILTNNFQI